MSDYIAYHSVRKMGRPFESTTHFEFYSRKAESILRRAIGERAWCIEGTPDGRSTVYRLVGVFTPSELRREHDGYWIVGEGTPFRPPIDVTEAPWLPRFMRRQRNFRLGFSLIRTEGVVPDLEHLRNEYEATSNV
jgi:hypothetical protein